MLIITECRKCNRDSKACPIKAALKGKLHNAGITENLRYRCGEWKNFRKYNEGDEVMFDYMYFRADNVEQGWRSVSAEIGKPLTGTITGVVKEKAMYLIRISQELFNEIGQPKTYEILDDEHFNPTGFYNIPVREKQIIKKLNIEPNPERSVASKAK